MWKTISTSLERPASFPPLCALCVSALKKNPPLLHGHGSVPSFRECPKVFREPGHGDVLFMQDIAAVKEIEKNDKGK